VNLIRQNAIPLKYRRRGNAGFLLIEVVLGMIILVLVTVGMYRIMSAALETAAEVRETKSRQAEINAFVDLMRRTMRTLPNRATVLSRVNSGGQQPFVELVIQDAPGVFAFGPASYFYGIKTLGPRPQLGGLLTMTLGFEAEEPEDAFFNVPAEVPPPVHLLRDVRRIEWLFFDEAGQRWIEAWEAEGTRPRLIQMNLTIAGDPAPTSAVFWLPPMGEMPSAAAPSGPEQGPPGEGS